MVNLLHPLEDLLICVEISDPSKHPCCLKRLGLGRRLGVCAGDLGRPQGVGTGAGQPLAGSAGEAEAVLRSASLAGTGQREAGRDLALWLVCVVEAPQVLPLELALF